MKVINVKIANFALALESDNEEQLNKLVNAVNSKINNVKAGNPGIADIKALLITLLFLQETAHNIESSVSIKADLLAGERCHDIISSFNDIMSSASDKVEALSNLINSK